MTHVAVTGSSGKLGRAVVARLEAEGHRITRLDTAVPPEPRGDFTRVDLTDYGQTLDALIGVNDRYDSLDAVVHLAAIPAPGLYSDVATFHHNIAVTFNVFQAAKRAGIKNIVYASSETVLGLPFSTDPPYVPVDEEYPARPESNYSLVKHLEETMAAQFTRWDPELKIVGLRFSNVMDVEDYADFPSFDADPTQRIWNLWGYIDARDGAQAVLKGLQYAGTGFETYVIASPDTVMSRSSAQLVAEYFPDVPVTRELGEHETLLGIDKAKRMLGYAPEFSWRDTQGPTKQV